LATARAAAIERRSRIARPASIASRAPAEQSGVTICVELLNSRVDHADYHGDRTAFGVEIVSAVNSPRVKLLYDIYHMQIMERRRDPDDRQNHQHIAHYHTGGVPGRHELDDSQECNGRRSAARLPRPGSRDSSRTSSCRRAIR
jgi:hydroxypyruvate isomerase